MDPLCSSTCTLQAFELINVSLGHGHLAIGGQGSAQTAELHGPTSGRGSSAAARRAVRKREQSGVFSIPSTGESLRIDKKLGDHSEGVWKAHRDLRGLSDATTLHQKSSRAC